MDEEKLRQVMAHILRVPINSIGPESSMDNVPSWDSINHMYLVLALEEEFSVSIPDEEVADITSYVLIRAVVNQILLG